MLRVKGGRLKITTEKGKRIEKLKNELEDTRFKMRANARKYNQILRSSGVHSKELSDENYKLMKEVERINRELYELDPVKFGGLRVIG